MKNTFTKWRIITITMLSLAASVVVGCGESDPSNKILRVGTSPEYPPLESYHNGEIVGLDIDVITKIADHMGRKVQLHPLSFDNLIGALESNRIDLAISSLTVNEERAKKIDFSDPYYYNSFSIVYRNGHPIKSKTEMEGKKIGAQTGSTMDHFLKSANNVSIFSLNSNIIMIEELKLGRIDGVLLETAQAVEFTRTNPSLRYNQLAGTDASGYSIALPKNSKLTHEVNAALQKIKDSGELDGIIKRWIIEEAQPQEVTQQEELAEEISALE